MVEWWVMTGSNRRHSPCKGDALPTELITHSLTNEERYITVCLSALLAPIYDNFSY
ncbi:MAG: hypothetical protein RLZZ151_424 [Pseudomonadota bacterium]|jgi:hypothetical protein